MFAKQYRIETANEVKQSRASNGTPADLSRDCFGLKPSQVRFLFVFQSVLVIMRSDSDEVIRLQNANRRHGVDGLLCR